MATAIRSAFPNARLSTDIANNAVSVLAGGAHNQRRRSPRAPYTTPVRMTFPDRIVDGRSEDISEGGLLVIASASCQPNARMNIRFALPMEGRVIGCDAHLRWSRCARSDATEGPHALGIEFIDPPVALTASIARYVQLMATRSTLDPSVRYSTARRWRGAGAARPAACPPLRRRVQDELRGAGDARALARVAIHVRDASDGGTHPGTDYAKPRAAAGGTTPPATRHACGRCAIHANAEQAPWGAVGASQMDTGNGSETAVVATGWRVARVGRFRSGYPSYRW